MLKLYNSLSRKKELFKPMHDSSVNMYVCGMTVYDFCHLGHARSMVSFDVIARYLRNIGYKLKYVKNITDIDDKIINRANELGISIHELTEKYIYEMHADEKALNILPPDSEPRATDHISEIISLIEKLIDNRHAYLGESGDVYYEVSKFKDYGKLSQKNIDGLMAGARVEISEDKRSPLDFVLWKKAKDHEPSWSSPWGNGRPGWHIECSAMASCELGEQFDIHGGGLDLQFPHHENEIAQSEVANCKPFANYWLHSGMLQINNEKMSKSTGNFYTIKDVLKKYHPEVIRYFLLSSHYRSPLNYSEENITNAGRALARFYQAIKDIKIIEDVVVDSWVLKFNQAMEDDINTPVAISILFELSHEVNKSRSAKLANTLIKLSKILGFLTETPDVFLQTCFKNLAKDQTEIASLINKRNIARAEKNWAEADSIRKELLADGIELEDTANGTEWRLAL
ncbi:MAG: cysteine--tRNA ligase [Legionellales bacterium RIFCSPHIGHO2_12_FULL_35_11]|nr:MAG: cysteine--tRNA ligase [Legionellales bacterium RIFCSPHIGHO2_12_FULL_35_11]